MHLHNQFQRAIPREKTRERHCSPADQTDLLMARLASDTAIMKTSLQNIEVGNKRLPFGVFQQIGVMKRLMGEAGREECGKKRIKVTPQTHN